MAGSRTRINFLEGRYANRYTTILFIQYLPPFQYILFRMFAFKNDGNAFLRKYLMKISLPDGESNPGLPRDRRGFPPLYYR